MAIEGVPEKMLACQVIEYNKPYKIHEVPTPRSVGEHDLLIKVAAASLCHTDGMVQAGTFHTPLPFTASHEGTGTVIAIGSGVEGFKKGDRVLAGMQRGRCGVCSNCQGPDSYQQYCTHQKGAVGVNLDGAFAEYMIIDGREASILDDSTPFRSAAPLACAGITVWRGILQANLTKGQWLCLVGSGGGLGHLGIQFAKALGLQVIGIDARDEGLELSKVMGADLVIDARQSKDKVVEEVGKVTNGEGADATLCLSDADSAAGLACAVTKMHGTMVQIAQPLNVSIPFREFIFRDIKVHGSLIASRKEAQRMLKLVGEHSITVETNPFYGLKEVPHLVELAHSGKIKGKGVVIIDENAVNV
ncbi:MAG: hypothetical protein M1827_000788 [Pycnora praestabilis]|nr:MAG: hypothetical protein M1827_000788 [Pycnora praestabilis]